MGLNLKRGIALVNILHIYFLLVKHFQVILRITRKTKFNSVFSNQLKQYLSIGLLSTPQFRGEGQYCLNML